MKFTIAAPPSFNFWRTVYSHGWCSLPPFNIDKEAKTFSRIVSLQSGKNIIVVFIGKGKKLHVEVEAQLSKKDHEDLKRQIQSCFRLDEDFSEFYTEAKRYPHFRWIPKSGAGRMLRAPTVFEDVVKMMCTTNCSWALTEIMIDNLCRKLGYQIDERRWSFPSPEAIADANEKYLRKEIRAGYRSPYLLELSHSVASGELHLESWRDCTLTTEELFDEVHAVKGVGPYAAGNILKLLGRYDYLGIDSWCRKKFFELHKNGRKATDKAIEKFYAPFGKWRGLFFWMDVTQHWYDQKFPF